jgi:branched-chain amino acid transport system substrate-binding protein
LADKLAGSYIKIHPYANIATCSEESSVDNESFRNQFTNGVLAQNSTQPVVNNSSGFENQFTNGVLAQTANHPDVKLEKYPCDFSAKNFDSNVTIANLIQRGVDTLLLSPHVDRINKATDIARANHGRLRLLGSPTLYTSATLELGKSAVNDLLLEAPWYSNLSNDDPFSREAAKLWGGPVNWRTAMSYDATKVIVSGLKQMIETGVQITPTREKLKDALRNSEFSVKGASGTIRFIQSGERQIDANLGILVQVKPVPSSQFGYDFVPLSSVQQTSNSPIAP